MILLVRASDVVKDAEGNVITFKAGETVMEFKTGQEFKAWVDEHIMEIDDHMQPFSGSASLFVGALNYINHKRKELVAQ